MVTTAVEEPEMMAPRTMDCSMLRPRIIPAMTPAVSITGTIIMTTIMAKGPILRSFFRLSSIPMQNIIRTRPRSARNSTISLVSLERPDQ